MRNGTTKLEMAHPENLVGTILLHGRREQIASRYNKDTTNNKNERDRANEKAEGSERNF